MRSNTTGSTMMKQKIGRKPPKKKKTFRPFQVTFLLSQYIAASSTAVTEQVFRKYNSENHFGHHKSSQIVLR
jgi:hypothetical protein